MGAALEGIPDMVLRSIAAAVLLSSSLALPAQAQATGTTYVFQTVDAFEMVNSNTVRITGILQGQAEAQTITIIGWSFGNSTTTFDSPQRCERLALMSMAKPGRYLFSVTASNISTPGFNPSACKLSLIPQG
jgi:hypothetical protein